MAARNGLAKSARRHVVLVPGFGAFDALGRVEYYAGITRIFQNWTDARQDSSAPPLVLHYFDNLPTAAVETRAKRLRQYLAKRIARGEIRKTDEIVLVGHSTGGLDIRQLVYDLREPQNAVVPVDGGYPVSAESIRGALKKAVFLSVPHWGTNIADWVCSHVPLRKTVIRELRVAFAGSQLPLLDRLEAALTGDAACFTGAELLLAVRDLLTESDDRLCRRDPTRLANAQEAESEVALYLRHMDTDFHVITDLASDPHQGAKNPAHFNDKQRAKELRQWKDPLIETLSYATVGGRPFKFDVEPGSAVRPFELSNPCDLRQVADGSGSAAGTDISYRLTYRACAGGPFHRPVQTVARVLGPAPPQPLQLWDNDGIVNTLSMLWPTGDTTLVWADHLDIIGHYVLTLAKPEADSAGCQPPRVYLSYDSLRSAPLFEGETFRTLWEEIFDFAARSDRP